MRTRLRLRRLLLLGSLACAATGCSTTQPPGQVYCQNITIYPQVQLLYPSPGATGVPPGLGTIVYGSFANGHHVAVAPISLSAGPTQVVQTIPTSLPSPLPSPAASPRGTPQLLAVAVPHLASATKYEVLARLTALTCGNPPSTFQSEIGSFKTR